MRSSNPALRGNAFATMARQADSGAMTIQGTVNKTFILLALTLFSASFIWGNPQKYLPFMIPAVIGGLIVAIVTIFKKEWAPVTSPIYALLEGLVIGAISALMERSYPGIVTQAVILTFGTLFCLLMAYKSRLIKASENFKLGVMAATGAVALVYIVGMVMSLFGGSIPLIHNSGPVGIIFSLVVVTIAALNLVLDFDFIEKGSQCGAPKYMEWYGAFGLMVTLIWLYLEILRLLAKLRRR
ncbi:MAG: Bax inhibitor-1/YccA family protein [Candidatus Omnitrophica bacterium]|nr:Bax inhibitor-1/YccA family protein [Candidatus Omnitrophota bacterium]